MCGIFAIYAPTRSNETRHAILAALTRTLKHRGPDHQGEWHDDDIGLGLGQRRLAIVDLSSDGQQPMISATRRYVISFNGEIYNFGTLRDELRTHGVVFRGRSDTEVLLAAIEQWGLNTTCQKINGMFSIVLYDKQERVLHLIRDRFGKKPLYFGWAGPDFLCASELKPFLAHPDFKREISPKGVSQYLQFGWISAPHCIFDNVQMLLPGCRVMVDLKGLRPGQLSQTMESFWSPARVVDEMMIQRTAIAKMPYSERVRMSEQVIETAVKDRCVVDVPLGAFLSGGIDSSTVVALMQKNSHVPIKTYSIGFEEAGFNEAPYAAAVAHHLGTDHHEQILTLDTARSIIPDLPMILDEPMADASIIPTYLVSKFARTEVTVALSGDGGDELFGGYHRHMQMGRIMAMLSYLPMPLRQMIQPVIRSLAPLVGRGDPQAMGRYQKLATLLDQKNLSDLYLFLVGGAEANVFTSQHSLESRAPFYQSSYWPTQLTAAEWTMFGDTIHYLPNDILTKVDRASMAVSLETRAPLLDMRVFAHAWSLPLSDKIKNGHGKHILRDILYRHVPQHLVDRPKQGFGVPIGSWLRGPLRDWADDLIHNPSFGQQFGFNATDLDQVWQDFTTGRKRSQETIWRLSLLSSWAGHWLR